MFGLKPIYGGSIPSFLELVCLYLDEGRLFKCVVGRRAAVKSLYVRRSEFYR